MPRVDAPIIVPVAGTGLVASVPGAGAGAGTGGLVVPSGLVSSSPTSSAPNPNAVIPGTDFTIIDKPKRKAVVLLFGDAGTGKTTFGIKYTPQQAVLIGFDGRSEYVEEAMKLAGHPVPAVQISPPAVLQKSDNVKVSAQETLKKFFRNYDGAIAASRTGTIKTIVIDTATELGAIIQLAIRGTLDQVKGDFGRSKDQINQIWRKIFDAARYTGNAHLIMLARAGAIWENNEPTGDFKARVADEVREGVDFALHIRLAPKLAGLTAGMGGGPGLVGPGGGVGLVAMGPAGGIGGIGGMQKEFELVVKKSGNTNPTKDLGLVLRESDWGEDGPFAYACSRLMPGSQPSDWR